jgi:F0F1-type ATP synthase delta subunit
MFFAERWAVAFTSALDALPGDSGKPEACRNLEEGLDLLKVLVHRVKKIPGYISGRTVALHVGAMLRSAAGTAGISLEDGRAEAVIKFISLLIWKNNLKHTDAVIRKIEAILDKRKGVLQVGLETVFSVEEDFAERLKSTIRRKTGAGEVRLQVKENPALLGGYRLMIGNNLVDASLSTLLQKMTADLSLPTQMNVAGGF